MARSSAPARRLRHVSHEREEGGGKRGECVDTMQWATVREEKVGRREEGKEGSAWMARLSAPARRFRHASHEREEGKGRSAWMARSSAPRGEGSRGCVGHSVCRVSDFWLHYANLRRFWGASYGFVFHLSSST